MLYSLTHMTLSSNSSILMNSYFVIVSSKDTPVYEADFFRPELANKVTQPYLLKDSSGIYLIYFIF